MAVARMPVGSQIPVASPPVVDPAALEQTLANLYREQLTLAPDNGYLLEHARPACVANQVRTFQWYQPHLPDVGNVLDWGCNHAPDSCMLRACYGEQLTLHSCDFVEPSRFQCFHDFARTAHQRLHETVALPYESNYFDAVIGSGVLEHTAMDYESLKELHRVLRPDGLLVVSYLPNWLSLQEWVRRVVHQRDFHRRLYGMSETNQLLKRAGFYPFARGYHTFIWERLLTAMGLRSLEKSVAPILGRLLPIQVFGATLYFLARKVTGM